MVAKLFQNGRKDADDKSSSGRPTTSKIDENVQTAKKIVLENCHY